MWLALQGWYIVPFCSRTRPPTAVAWTWWNENDLFSLLSIVVTPMWRHHGPKNRTRSKLWQSVVTDLFASWIHFRIWVKHLPSAPPPPLFSTRQEAPLVWYIIYIDSMQSLCVLLAYDCYESLFWLDCWCVCFMVGPTSVCLHPDCGQIITTIHAIPLPLLPVRRQASHFFKMRLLIFNSLQSERNSFSCFKRLINSFVW